jgi:3-hydroxyisobutyrate dehydrogenase-like beta-hydroxyacid dehydrogenase
MNTDNPGKQERRDFLQAAGAASVTLALGGLPLASSAAGPATTLRIEKVGLMSPGDMGQALAIQIKAKGLTVYTALEHRSERTRTLAREAGLIDLGTLSRLTVESDVVLSVLNPGAALDFAGEFAGALRATGSHALFVDCNAIAPDTVRAIAAVIEGAGGRFIDAGIIGPPPRGSAKTNLFVSGPGAGVLEQLGGPQITVRVIGDRLSDASALKMCYGALTKGTQALWLNVLIAAQHLGVDGLLDEQLGQSQAALYDWALRQFPIMPPKAYRWVPEMLENVKTLESAGITAKMSQGTADVYRFVAATPLGKETPENRDRARDGREVVRLLAKASATTAGRSANAQKQ